MESAVTKEAMARGLARTGVLPSLAEAGGGGGRRALYCD
jgi:hypothetical protein